MRLSPLVLVCVAALKAGHVRAEVCAPPHYKDGLVACTTHYTGDPNGEAFYEIDLSAEVKEKNRGVHVFEYNDPNDGEHDEAESIFKLGRRLFVEFDFSCFSSNVIRTFVRGWYHNTLTIKRGKMKFAYLEVNDKSSQSVWEYINKPAQWAVDATADRAGINIDLVDLLCGSVGDTVFTPYQAMLPSFPGNPDDSYSFSSVGNTKVMAIQCSAPYDRVAPTCLDSDEIQFLGPSLNWPHIIYFFVGAFLVAQALALGKERVVWQGGISLFFFVAIMLSVVWWAKNQGRTAKYMTGAIGMAGISISKVLAKNTSMLLAVIVQSQYLVGGVVALVLMAFVLAIWFEPERKARDIISDLLLTVVGIIIMAANEPFPHCGVVLGVTLAIAVHLHILVNEVTGVVKKVLLAISNTLYTILWVVTLPFRPVLWALTFIFSLLGISTNLLTSLVSAPPKVWIQPQTVQEYESEGLMNTAMEIENTRVNQIEPNTRLYRRTQRVEEGATSAGALSPAGRVRTDYGLHTQLARARGTSPAAARLWAARRESMPLPAENDITEDELNASMQEYN